MYLSGLLDGLFGSEMRLLRLMGRTLAASKISSLFGIILSPIFHAKMTIRRPWGAPWEAHGVPFGDPRACPKPLFCQNGDHEQTLLYTAFAPLYDSKGRPFWHQRRPQWSKVSTAASRSVGQDTTKRVCLKSTKNMIKRGLRGHGIRGAFGAKKHQKPSFG